MNTREFYIDWRLGNTNRSRRDRTYPIRSTPARHDTRLYDTIKLTVIECRYIFTYIATFQKTKKNGFIPHRFFILLLLLLISSRVVYNKTQTTSKCTLFSTIRHLTRMTLKYNNIIINIMLIKLRFCVYTRILYVGTYLAIHKVSSYRY